MKSCIVNFRVKIFRTPYDLAEEFAEELVKFATESAQRRIPLSIALSGGSTPELLYSVIGDHFSNSAKWEYVHFFWSDERCVPTESQESNYGMAWRALLSRINIPLSNLHRIIGENVPEKEASRYSKEILEFTRQRDGMPVFDMIILGLGEDGHTASIFPSNILFMDSEKICEVASHPLSMQKRITLTGRVINNADLVTFIVTGKKKAEIVEKIIKKSSTEENFPASRIVPVHGELRWLLDKEAATLL
jgi:6-phosphogluconolactonase